MTSESRKGKAQNQARRQTPHQSPLYREYYCRPCLCTRIPTEWKEKKIHQSYKHLSVKWKRLLNLSFQWPGRSSASCDPLPSFNGTCRGQKLVYTRAAEIYADFDDLCDFSNSWNRISPARTIEAIFHSSWYPRRYQGSKKRGQLAWEKRRPSPLLARERRRTPVFAGYQKTRSRGPFLESPGNFSGPVKPKQNLEPYDYELFYSRILNMKRGSLHTAGKFLAYTLLCF